MTKITEAEFKRLYNKHYDPSDRFASKTTSFWNQKTINGGPTQYGTIMTSQNDKFNLKDLLILNEYDADLSGFDLSGMCFKNVDFKNINLSYCDMSNCDISYANLNDARLHETNLKDHTKDDSGDLPKEGIVERDKNSHDKYRTLYTTQLDRNTRKDKKEQITNYFKPYKR